VQGACLFSPPAVSGSYYSHTMGYYGSYDLQLVNNGTIIVGTNRRLSSTLYLLFLPVSSDQRKCHQ